MYYFRKVKLGILALLVASITCLSCTGMTYAQSTIQSAKDQACQGVGLTGGGCGGGDAEVSKVIKVAINLLSFIAGITAVIMIIVAGFKYMTSSGDAGNISSAKNALLYALVGLIVVAMSQGLVRFVLSNVK